VRARKSWSPIEGSALIGTPAPEWKGVEWIQGEPTTLADLRGKVVLVRFWLMGCSYCTRTAPALRDLSKRYQDRGLVVVGLHHPKSDSARDPKAVAQAARSLGLEFRVGLDNDWETIRAYGVGSVFKRFTSVTFLIDRQGVIRFVHDGGEFHEDGPGHEECTAAYRALEAAIADALS
jgi:peroxiredoxin